MAPSLPRTVYIVKFKNGTYWARRGKRPRSFYSAGIISTKAVATAIYNANRRKGAKILKAHVPHCG